MTPPPVKPVDLEAEADAAVVRSVWGMKPAAVASQQAVEDWTRTAAQFVRNRVTAANAALIAEVRQLRERSEVLAFYHKNCVEGLGKAEAEVRKLRDTVHLLKAGAPVIRCCDHCEMCNAEREEPEDATESKPGEPPSCQYTYRPGFRCGNVLPCTVHLFNTTRPATEETPIRDHKFKRCDLPDERECTAWRKCHHVTVHNGLCNRAEVTHAAPPASKTESKPGGGL